MADPDYAGFKNMRFARDVVVKTDPYSFMVDGDEFPWWLSQRGPLVERVSDGLYTVDVEICLLDKNEHPGVFPHPYLAFGYLAHASSVPNIPLIAGEEFPWLLTGDGWTLTCGHKQMPKLRVSFYALNVSGDVEIADRRSEFVGEDIYCNGGDLIRQGAA